MVWTKYWVTEQDAYPLPAPFWLHFSFWENCLLKDRNNKYYTIQYFKTQWLILITQQMDCCFLIDYWFSRWSWELWCSSCVCSLHAGIPCACECSLPRYALCIVPPFPVWRVVWWLHVLYVFNVHCKPRSIWEQILPWLKKCEHTDYKSA